MCTKTLGRNLKRMENEYTRVFYTLTRYSGMLSLRQFFSSSHGPRAKGLTQQKKTGIASQSDNILVLPKLEVSLLIKKAFIQAPTTREINALIQKLTNCNGPERLPIGMTCEMLEQSDPIKLRYLKDRIEDTKKAKIKSGATRIKVEISLSGDLIQIILLHCVQPNTRFKQQFDMFYNFSSFRRICKSFYFAMLDIWPMLQEEIFQSVQQYIDPLKNSTTRTASRVLELLDPSLTSTRCGNGRSIVVTTMTYMSVLREKLWHHLRCHACPYLIIMAMNERELNGESAIGIPILSGFASFIDSEFGFIVKNLSKQNRYCDAIDLFYVYNDARIWNMLSVNQSKSLETYLQDTLNTLNCAPHKDGKWSRLHCKISTSTGATENIFLPNDLWPKFLMEYVVGDEVKQASYTPPPVRLYTFSLNQKKFKVVAELTLPLRKLRKCSFSGTEWESDEKCVTMNITTDMLTETLRTDRQSLNVFTPSGHFMDSDSELSFHNFTIWSEILLMRSARKHTRLMYRLEMFRNFSDVLKSIHELLDLRLIRTNYITSEENGNWLTCPIHQDWGFGTHLIYNEDLNRFCIEIDASVLLEYSDKSIVHRRYQWSSSEYIDLRDDTYMDGSLLKSSFKLDEIDSLMRIADLNWSRHTFPTAEKMTRALYREVQPSKRKKIYTNSFISVGGDLSIFK